MRINYRKSLEEAARQMILIHRTDTLVRLILRTIERIIGVRHAGLFIFDKQRDCYVLRASRGFPGLKIPSGFAKLETQSPLIRYFTDRSLPFARDALVWDKVNYYLKSRAVKRNPELAKFLESLKFNLSLYHVKVCIPAFFRDDLIAILFLGGKNRRQVFREEELGFLSVLASDMAMAIKNAWLVDDLNLQLQKNKQLFLQIVSALASSIEAKDKYTKGHTERVVSYSLVIAKGLRKSFPQLNWDKFLADLKISALLHDIGKIGIPEAILNKPATLTDSERKTIEQHPLIGVNILSGIDGFEQVLLGVKHHHERFDGNGYPGRIKGKKIPLIAAVISLADAFDAMTTDRPYRKALSVVEAIEEVQKNRNKQFGPRVVDAFLNMYKDSKDLNFADKI